MIPDELATSITAKGASVSILKEFKEFAVKGNVIDMAVGIIIGAAFGKIVSSLVGDVVMPPIGAILGGVDFSHLSITVREAVDDKPAVVMAYGKFLLTVLDFLIISSVIFAAVKVINTLKRKEEAAPAPPPAVSREEVLLAEIRDLLKAQSPLNALDAHPKHGQQASSYERT